MSACETLTAGASAGVAPALRAVDCLANETTSVAFARLFGSNGALLPALTIILTLYIAFFAFSLLTGRSRIGISALSPRMMTMGLVLTFATSWVAYQSVVWNLAVGGPDQIAGVLMGAQGSATQLFADRIDIVFAAIAEVGSATNSTQPGAVPAVSGSFTPGNLMWLAALLLMLGTVGVLVTARIALAVLLALGPIFVVFALFNGTRGLFAGWLRGVVLTAIAPLFAVLGGGFMLELAVPVVSALGNAEGMVDGRASMALFLIAAVHVALMVMVIRVCGTMVNSWQIFGLVSDEGRDHGARAAADAVIQASAQAAPAQMVSAGAVTAAGRTSAIAPVTMVQSDGSGTSQGPGSIAGRRTTVVNDNSSTASLPPVAQQRARGVGSRFRATNPNPKGMIR